MELTVTNLILIFPLLISISINVFLFLTNRKRKKDFQTEIKRISSNVITPEYVKQQTQYAIEQNENLTRAYKLMSDNQQLLSTMKSQIVELESKIRIQNNEITSWKKRFFSIRDVHEYTLSQSNIDDFFSVIQKEIIKHDGINSVFNILIKRSEWDTDIDKITLTNLKAKYKAVNDKYSRGTIDNEDFELEISKVRTELLKISERSSSKN